MKKHVASKTAEATAAIRAAHHRYAADPKVIQDPIAYYLLSPMWRFVVGNELLYKFLVNGIMKTKAGVFGCVVGRTRFTEDHLLEAVSAGIERYVILGAGLDTFAYRSMFLSQLQVVELDHPASQEVKLSRLRSRNIKIDPNVNHLPIDFTQERVSEKILSSGLAAAPTFFSWLGVAPYLEKSVIEKLFRDLKSVCRPGSRIAFDYIDAASFANGAHPTMLQIMEYAKNRGEPIVTGIDPGELHSFLADLGWNLKQTLSPEEQNALYFTNRADGLRATEHVHFALAECN